MKVQLFIPCFIDQLYPQTAFNMIKILEKSGCTVSYNIEQTCCGQPAFNSGFWKEARKVGEKFINDFSENGYVVSPGGSCAGYVRNFYPYLFDNSALHVEFKQLQKNIFEFTDFMVNVLGIEDVGAEFDAVATYHDACATLRELHVKTPPRRLLQHVKGLELREMNECETCCGFGGTFAVKYGSISAAMATQKVDNAIATGAEYIISTDLSCLMHLDGYIQKNNIKMKTAHIVDVLAYGQ